MEDIVEDIPLPHVEWIRSYLNQLSRPQLEAAFRAAGYSDQEVAAFVSAMQRQDRRAWHDSRGWPRKNRPKRN